MTELFLWLVVDDGNTYFKFTIIEKNTNFQHATFAMKRFILIVIFEDIAISTMDH